MSSQSVNLPKVGRKISLSGKPIICPHKEDSPEQCRFSYSKGSHMLTPILFVFSRAWNWGVGKAEQRQMQGSGLKLGG